MFLCVILISGYHVAIYVFGFLPLLLRHHPALFLLEPIWTLGQCWLSHRLGKWAQRNTMRFNKIKCNVLHLCWDSPRYEYRLRELLLVNSPAGKVLEVLGDGNLNRSACTLRGQLYPGLHQQRGGRLSEGGHCPSLVSLQSCIGLLWPMWTSLHMVLLIFTMFS